MSGYSDLHAYESEAERNAVCAELARMLRIAKLIAEKLTGKTVAGEKYKPDAKSLPYPAHPVIWQLDHPVHGLTPTFCFKPDQCAGCTSCPQNYSCTE